MCFLVSRLLEKPEVTVYSTFVLLGVRLNIRAAATWLRIVSVHIERYLNAYNLVTTTWQRSQETKEKFGTQFESHAEVSSSVFNEHLCSTICLF